MTARIRARARCARRLHQVIVGAEVEALDAVLELGPGGEDEDRDVIGLAQPAKDLDSVDLRKAEIEDHQVRQELGGGAQRLFAVAGGAHLVPLGPECAPKHVGDLCVVLDDQNATRDCLALQH